jgi:C1A family cysteine protease
MTSLINYIYYSIYGENAEPTMNPEPKRKYGWKNGETYRKTEKYVFDFGFSHSAIKQLDLREKCPAVYDQGHLGSCTANAIGFCYHFDELKQSETSVFQPSRLFIYYNERNMEGHTGEDSGAEIHDGVQCINTLGVCSEENWPYDITKFTEKPSDNCYVNAKNHHSISYRAIEQNINQLKAALIDGFPIVFGFSVYESFESDDVAKTGIMPLPKEGEKILGGHAVALVGFDDSKKVFIVRNSWGEIWGDKGYFYMPYEFIINSAYASDFWTITKTLDTTNSNMIENHLKNKLIHQKLIDNLIAFKEGQPEIFVISRRNRRKHKKH